MKFFCLFILLVEGLSVKAQTSVPKITADSTLIGLKNNKAAIDKYLEKHSKQMLVLVKIPRKSGLVHVYNGNWPNEVEYTLNILKNKDGKVVYIFKAPFSESGDWDMSYEHYFDDEGNVFAFYKDESVFDDNVKGGVVRSRLLKFYNKDFKVIKQNIWLADVKGKAIKASKQRLDFYDYKYTIYKNLAECLKGYNIKL